MKILLFIEERYPTDHVFLEEVYSKIFKQRGHEVIWVIRSQKEAKDITIKKWNDNKVYVLPSNKNIFLDYFNLILSLKKLKKKFEKEDFNLVYVRNEPIMGIFAKKISKMNKLPYIYQLTHLLSEETIYFAKKCFYGNRIKNLLIGYTSKFLTNYNIRKADFVFAISDSMVLYLKKKKLRMKDIGVLPLGVNPIIKKNFKDSEKLRDQYNLRKGKTLIYLGTLIRTRDPYFLFKIMNKLNKEDREIKLLVVGEGKFPSDLANYKKYVIEHSLQEQIIFTGQIPRYDVQNYLAVADIAISQFPPVYLLKMNSPIKLMEYLNAGLPVVCNNYNIEQKEIIEASGGGFCLNYSVDEFVQAILTLTRDQRLRKNMGKLGQRYIRDNRNYEQLATTAEKTFLKLIGERQKCIKKY